VTAKSAKGSDRETAADEKTSAQPKSSKGSTRENAPTQRRSANGGKGVGTRGDQPYGRDEVVDSIIEATLSLWESKGPANLTLRGIAQRAGVNYGLVYRHFGTKEAVIRAAMNKRLEIGLEVIADCEDLTDVMEVFLHHSSGTYARLLAWATLQYVLDDILPPEDLVLRRVLELAEQEPDKDAGDRTETAVKVGSLIAMAYGWRLFESYLVPELGLKGLDRSELDSRIREVMARIIDEP
jgi:AcrR family transcriptional regulator